MDYPAVEPLEQPLGAADRGVERHMLAGGVAVEGDVHVVDPGAGHHDSFCDRAQRLTYRPTGRPGSSLALTSCSVATVSALPQGPGICTDQARREVKNRSKWQCWSSSVVRDVAFS